MWDNVEKGEITRARKVLAKALEGKR